MPDEVQSPSASHTLLVRERELCRLLGVSRSTLFRWERLGIFPSRMKIGPHSVAWLTSNIDEWLRARADAPHSNVSHDT